MAENLKTTHYRNGASIPYVENNWGSNTAGAYTFFDNLQSNANIYGNLYNGYAVYDDRGICPESWHVPTEDEFVELISFLGDNAGGKLKEEGFEYWNSPNTGATNEVGFNGRGGGTRNTGTGDFNQFNIFGIYWVLPENTEDLTTYHVALQLSHNSVNLTLGAGSGINQGSSVRCLADEITTGCTDPAACNHDESANVDDGSCDYSCHDNGDYSLEFDGVNDWVEVEYSPLS